MPDNKKLNLCLLEKTKSREKITLIENKNLISDDAEVAD